MDPQEARQRALDELATVADERSQLCARIEELEHRERELIATLWTLGVPPGRIDTTSRRSPSYVRKLRPSGVPPARLGGGAARRPPRSTEEG